MGFILTPQSVFNRFPSESFLSPVDSWLSR